MHRHAQSERAALCDTFLQVGPDAPTLCSPWLTRDLAAHLVIRDGRPDAVASRLVPALADRSQRIMDAYAAQPWPALVDRVAGGAPWWSLVRLPVLDEAFNLGELFIHHEDVLRGGTGWTPRRVHADLEQALWTGLTRMGPLMVRRAPVGVVLVTPDHGRKQLKGATAEGIVVLKGTPGELTLCVSGRQRVAQVGLEGPDEAMAAFADSPLGIS